MPKKKKKQNPQERRAREKQRRIEAARKNVPAAAPNEDAARERQRRIETAEGNIPIEKPERDAAGKDAAGTQEKKERPEGAGKNRVPKARKPKPAPTRVDNPRYKSLQFRDGQPAGGDCTRYDVSFPARMDIQALFDAIRKERRDEHGTVYISLNLAEAGAGNHQLSYDYAGGMFTRREKPSKDKKAPLLAELLDRPVTKIRACGGWGLMDYYVNIRPADGPDGDAGTRPYDPSEIIPDA